VPDAQVIRHPANFFEQLHLGGFHERIPPNKVMTAQEKHERSRYIFHTFRAFRGQYFGGFIIRNHLIWAMHRFKMPKDTPLPSQQFSFADSFAEQVSVIQALSARLLEKEKQLAALGGQKWLFDELTHKLQETEARWQAASGQVQAQRQMLDELTTAYQHAEIKLTAALLHSRQAIAQNIVKTHIVAGMALGFIPLPLLDMAASSAVQANLLRNLCKQYMVDFDTQAGQCAVSSMLRGALPVLMVLGLSSCAKIIPGLGTLGGGISMTLFMGATVYATGQVFIRHFEAGGTLQNFNSKHWQAFFQQQFEEGKVFIKANRIKD
jgi:uncharacterized protein (DUF697 family)